MEQEEKKQLAEFLCEKLHRHYLKGSWFGDEEVLEEIDSFFKVKELITERDKLQKQIDELT